MEIDAPPRSEITEELKQTDETKNTQNVDDSELKSHFTCTNCCKQYKTQTGLHNHEKLCVQAGFERSEDTSNEMSCGACGQTFKYPKRLKKHEYMHEGEAELWCKNCVMYFPSKEDKEVHRAKQHSKKKKHKCKLCQDVVFDTEEEYFVHINDVHKGKSGEYYMCSDCGKQYKTKSELTHHNRSKCGTIKQYTCKICDQKLMTAGSLHNHMLRHTVQCSNMCGYCGKMFLTSGQLKVHERIHTQEKAFVCNVCGKGFCHRQSLITHSTLHTGVKPYQCENCGHSFSCVGNLIKHRKTHADTCGAIPLTSHRVDNPTTKMKVKMNTPITSKLKTLKKEKEKEDKLIACKNKLQQKTESIETEEMCKNVVADMINDEEPSNQKTDVEISSNHMEDCGEKRKSGDAEFEEFLAERSIVEETVECECRYCGRMYTNMRWLYRHEKEHQGLGSDTANYYKCSCCKMLFSTREECQEHKRHAHADLLSCLDCDKIFSNKDSLRSHCRLLHKGLPKKVYVYVCEKCGVQFKQKTFLNYHKKNNCGSGPIYECHVCGKGFHSIHTRRSHLRIHDPKKKFLCKYCGKSFRWKGQLKVHERSHTGEKPFKCLYCPKAFGYRESLITHSSLHTGIKPHLCQACGSRFSCIGNLIKHRTTHMSTCGAWYSKNQ